jgi:pyruvate dehydrogenase E1 component alpha subunit
VARAADERTEAAPGTAPGRELLHEDPDHARRLLRTMMLIRRFEERTEEQYTRARIGGYCHLAIGEEAATVGAVDVLGDRDYLFSSYRDHGTALAVGSPTAAVMAELFGKETGVARGRGGSMHLLDVERRFLGGWGIVGAHLPIAVGAALALDQRGDDGAVLCQFGDGAMATGSFHEALNLAAVWDLPVVFQVINNQYGMGTSVAQSSAEPDLWKRGCAYRVHGERVDGNDVLAVREATARLTHTARTRREPALLEAVTYRHRGHSVADAGKVYRTPEEIDSWRARDPIDRYADELRDAGALDDEARSALWDEVSAEVAAAIDDALGASFPDPDATLYEHLYGDADWKEQFARMEPGAPFGEREGTRRWRS